MSLGDQRCDDCGSKELHPFMGRALCLCRRCAGSFVQRLLSYIRGFDRDHPRPKKPKNPSKPITDLFGGARCRGCEVQMPDWKAGESPYCGPCDERGRHNRRDDPEKSGGVDVFSSSEAISPGITTAQKAKSKAASSWDPATTADEVPGGTGLLWR